MWHVFAVIGVCLVWFCDVWSVVFLSYWAVWLVQVMLATRSDARTEVMVDRIIRHREWMAGKPFLRSALWFEKRRR